MTRVAIFTDNDCSKANGLTTTLNAVRRFMPPDISIRVYTAADCESIGEDYLSVPAIGIDLPWQRETRVYWPRMRRFARALGSDRIDVMHLTTSGPVGLAARRLSRRVGRPLTGSCHSPLTSHIDPFTGSSHLGRAVERYVRWVYGACETVFLPTRAMSADFARSGFPAARLTVWERGVDISQFTPSRRGGDFLGQWPIDDQRPVVLYAGQLSRDKGLDVLPDIQRRLDHARIAHRLVFLGNGPVEPELRSRCPDATFLGCVSHDAVAVAMASADVFVFPSLTGTQGNAVLEAQASGLPVVVSDAAGLHEIMVDRVTGFVAKADSAEAIGDHVIRLLRNAGERREMGRRAREHAVAHTWSATLAPLARAWRTAADRRRFIPGRRVQSSPLEHIA